MASAHHLLAAAFSLCGLLFLLHVVTVNSLRCKTCRLTDEGCDSRDLPEKDCGSYALCRTVVFFYKNGDTQVTFRDCVNGKDWKNKCEDVVHSRNCYYYCDTDNCNNISYKQ
ncbi:uncharacterized protein LOC112564225 [Pomacea canaliculata]|uniref:uncharacterized protein LOC112564225 n=1 Tax=Pomacea canaliculata TaxID=400727 RepID=UPI000D726AC6|nr:uncharacterized protein LOC112564225 [Pomacea canaliculata]